jgi:hypothetical protein
MRRPAHGATAKPSPERPGNGYGRAVGRPRPTVPVVAAQPLEPERFVDPGGDRSSKPAPSIPA